MEKKKRRCCQKRCDPQDQRKRRHHIFFHLPDIPPSVTDGEKRASAHAHADDDRGQECHERIGASHCRKRPRSHELSHDPGVCQVIALLEHISQDHGHSKKEHGGCHAPSGKIALSALLPFWLLSRLFRISPAIFCRIMFCHFLLPPVFIFYIRQLRI